MDLKERYLILLHAIKELASDTDQLHIAKTKQKIDNMVDELSSLDKTICKEDKEWNIGSSESGSTFDPSNYYDKTYIDNKIKELTQNTYTDEEVNKAVDEILANY